MGLANRLRRYPAAEEPKYRARTEFDGSSGFIQTSGLPVEDAPEHEDILRQFGYDPDRVRIVGEPRVTRWEVPYRPVVGENEHGKPIFGELVTRWLASYRFHLAPVGPVASDLDEIVQRARGRVPVVSGASWAVFQAGDLQLGKRSRDGATEEILARWVESVTAAREQLVRWSVYPGIAGLQISMPGDCIEGNQSQGGRNLWLTELTVTEQVRVLRRLMMHALEWNAAVFGHVEVRVPEQWSGSMTVPVGDSVVTIAHGHQWRRGKAMDWWAGQALNNQPAAGAHVLQNGHWHEWQLESTEDRTRIGSPTFDCGSDWFRNAEGGTARRGGLMYLLNGGQVSQMSVV